MLRFTESKYSKEIGIKLCSGSVSGSAASVSTRFGSIASVITGTDHIGLQLTPSGSGWKVFAISNKEIYLGDEDLNWIFRPVTSQSEHPLVRMKADTDSGLKTFAVRVPAAREYSVDSEERYQSCFIGELLDLMSECGATIQILEGRDKGIILLKTPGYLPLRLRARFSSFFGGSALKPADELSTDDIKSDNLFLKILIKNIIAEIIIRYESSQDDNDDDGAFPPMKLFDIDDPDTELPDDPEDSDDTEKSPEDKPEQEDPNPGKQITIEEMDFSVRTYNCLKRAGINNAEQLQKMTEEEMRSVRLLGQKNIDEIKAKLRDMFGTDLAIDSKKSYLEQLDELIGLEDVKEQVRRIVAFARMKKDFSDRGREDISVALNMAFVGNPGTAKTTVARIIAGIFHEIGITQSDDLIEVGRSGLVGEFVGKTALKVESVFEKAKGKVLFIDEAYSLLDHSANSFGDEAINTIVRQMENQRKDTIVIFAGYSDKMEDFLSRNPGLRSRVPFVIEFKDYPVETLVRIAELEASRFGFGITQEAREKIFSLCSEAVNDPEFGNGRFCRNLVENALIDYAAGAYGTESLENTPEPVLDAVNFSLPLNMKKTRTPKKFGFI